LQSVFSDWLLIIFIDWQRHRMQFAVFMFLGFIVLEFYRCFLRLALSSPGW